jgi:signal transduction histidine kinase
MGFVAVARVTPERWLACAVLDDVGIGLQAGSELDIHATLCKEHLAGKGTMAFDDALSDEHYRGHPVPALYGFRSYISSPIRLADGSYFGSLFAIDPEPRGVSTAAMAGMIEGFAGLIGLQLDEARAHRSTRTALTEEQSLGSSREEFIAVVAHDLRNPLATMHTAGQLLTRSSDAAAARVGTRLLQSANRMLGLINDLVDYARGRAGSAMPIQLGQHAELGAALEEVVEEVREANPGWSIQSDILIPCPVQCEPARLQQLLSNLLGNAIAHGAAGEPILVHASESEGTAVIRVTNRGTVIPAPQLARVFEAYWQAVPRKLDASMGLGLHICQLIASAHGGTLTARSDAQHGTTFELRWPSGCDVLSD